MAFCCSGRGKTLKLHSHPSGAMPHAAFVCRYSGQIKVIRVDALDLVDGLSCHSDAVFNNQVSQP